MTYTRTVDKPAMQTRCIWCQAETYAPNVYQFSLGETPCHSCGGKTEPLTEAEYRHALYGFCSCGAECGEEQISIYGGCQSCI